MSSDALNTSTISKKMIHYLRHIAQRQKIFFKSYIFFCLFVCFHSCNLFIYLGFYVAFNTVQKCTGHITTLTCTVIFGHDF